LSRLTQDEWEEKYLPIKNPNNDWGGDYSSFETYSPDVTFVSEQPDNTIWTEMDGEDGVYIVSGYHLVNRIQYYITQKPWTEDVSIPVCLYKDCDCQDDGEGNPDCQECDGDGVITFWIETREELEEIYGKATNE
jgi:hypothetical protein